MFLRLRDINEITATQLSYMYLLSLEHYIKISSTSNHRKRTKKKLQAASDSTAFTLTPPESISLDFDEKHAGE